MLLVLSIVGRDRLGDDLPRDAVIVNVRVTAGARCQLRAIDRDHTGVHQPRSGAQSQHGTEQLVERLLVTADEPGDRRVIRHLVTGDDPVGDVLTAASLDPARRPLIRRIGEQDKAHHHRRLVGGAAMTVRAIGRVERLQVEPADCVDHEPRQMILRQPIPQRRRQKKRLLTITIDEVLGHAGIPPAGPDRTPLCDSHRAKRVSWRAGVELRRNTNAGLGPRAGRPRLCRKPAEAEVSSPIGAAPEGSPCS